MLDLSCRNLTKPISDEYGAAFSAYYEMLMLMAKLEKLSCRLSHSEQLDHSTIANKSVNTGQRKVQSHND